jgi:hypothetical protein
VEDGGGSVGTRTSHARRQHAQSIKLRAVLCFDLAPSAVTVTSTALEPSLSAVTSTTLDKGTSERWIKEKKGLSPLQHWIKGHPRDVVSGDFYVETLLFL